mmetsp:Transcript_100989/g.324255  ORF Transcript_100989/g.324255 Transcript_100989/m.324255 type:complete len:290 (+) Transcript_100989:1379-2248(+)
MQVADLQHALPPQEAVGAGVEVANRKEPRGGTHRPREERRLVKREQRPNLRHSLHGRSQRLRRAQQWRPGREPRIDVLVEPLLALRALRILQKIADRFIPHGVAQQYDTSASRVEGLNLGGHPIIEAISPLQNAGRESPVVRGGIKVLACLVSALLKHLHDGPEKLRAFGRHAEERFRVQTFHPLKAIRCLQVDSRRLLLRAPQTQVLQPLVLKCLVLRVRVLPEPLAVHGLKAESGQADPDGPALPVRADGARHRVQPRGDEAGHQQDRQGAGRTIRHERRAALAEAA